MTVKSTNVARPHAGCHHNCWWVWCAVGEARLYGTATSWTEARAAARLLEGLGADAVGVEAHWPAGAREPLPTADGLVRRVRAKIIRLRAEAEGQPT